MPNLMTSLHAIEITPAAMSAASAKGVNLSALIANAIGKAHELRQAIEQILAAHPNDDANVETLRAMRDALGPDGELIT